MGVFTFVCRSSGEEWSGKQLKGELEASAPSTFDLQRKLVQLASATDSPAAGVQSSFSFVTPTSAVFQVIIGGGGAASAAAPEAPPAAAEAASAEEKKEEIEESDGEDYNFSLFD